MTSDDSVCYYLLEAVKPGAEAIFRGRGLGELLEVISELIQPMSLRWGRVRRKIESAKGSGSRLTRMPPRDA
jgi:hypothetical protein